MKQLAGWIGRHRRLVLLGWLVLLLAALPFAVRQSEDLQIGGFEIPGSQSQRVHEELLKSFDERNQLALVVVPRFASEGERRAAATRVLAGVDEVPDTALPPKARQEALDALAGGRPAVVPIGVTSGQDREPDTAKDLREELGADGSDLGGVSAFVIGRGALDAALLELSTEQLEKAEAIGLPIVLVLLLLIFGSLAAAALPLVLGAVAVLLTGAGIYALAQFTPMSVFATNMASMIGIGVAVDYSLFVLVRYREELAAGRGPDEARARALSTSGVAIVFSGLTVIVSLGGMWLVDTDAVRSLALGAMIVVAFAILVSVTLLPAVIQLMGRRLERRPRSSRLWPRRALRGPAPAADGEASAFWTNWTRRILRRPYIAAAGATAALLLLAAPALDLATGENLLEQLPAGNDTRTGYENATAIQGPGAVSPIAVLLREREGARADGGAAAAAALRAIEQDRGVQLVDEARTEPGGGDLLIPVIARQAGDEEPTKDLVLRLRDELPALTRPHGYEAEVGGPTAYILDFEEEVVGNLWKVALFVALTSCLLLTIMLRSILLPLKAALMNVLSVGAAYGVMVAVFQWGWLDGFLGFESKGFIDTASLGLVLVMVFGLSMDYEIFLLSRIRERYRRTGDPEAAVAQGLAASARTITGAAAIMVAVFLVFVGTSIPAVKEVGLGLAVAIAVDATIVRLVLVPATMQILGRWNWWLPAPLAALLDRRGGVGATPELAP